MIPSSFFPGVISHFFTHEKQGTAVLSEREKEIARSYGAKRLLDFCTGRYCLRRCTEAYGFSGDILIGEKGMPILPDNIAASVSHSKNLCGAVACSKDQFLSVGLDIETSGRLGRDLWHLLFTDAETQFLGSLSPEQQDEQATIFFSLKEAFYKLQYPLTRIYLDFKEVEVAIVADSYYVQPLLRVGGLFGPRQPVLGSVHRHSGEIITLFTLPADTITANSQ